MSKTPIEKWLTESTKEELLDGVDWLQSDAAYTYKQARGYAEVGTPQMNWIAGLVQLAAAHSSAYARAGLARLETMA